MSFSRTPALVVGIALQLIVSLASQAAQERNDDFVAIEKNCAQGYYRLAIDQLKETYARATSRDKKAHAAALLGKAYARINKSESSIEYLTEATETIVEPGERARLLVELGNMYVANMQWETAERAYNDALGISENDPALVLTVELNRLRIPTATQSLAKLEALAEKIRELPSGRERVRLSLSHGFQSKALGENGKTLAQVSFDEARLGAQHRRRG